MEIISKLAGAFVSRLAFYWSMGLEGLIMGIILTVGAFIWHRIRADLKIADDAKAERDTRQAP